MKSAKEIDLMIDELEDLEVKYSARRAEATAANDLAETKRNELLQELEAQGLESFKGNKGTIGITTRYSVKFPKDIEVKKQLRDAIGEENFLVLCSINHASLNAYYKQEVEQARVEGRYLDLPGLDPVSDKFLTFRKNSK